MSELKAEVKPKVSLLIETLDDAAKIKLMEEKKKKSEKEKTDKKD